MFDHLSKLLEFPWLGLQGFGPLLLMGAWMTIKLSLLSVVLSVFLGLLGAVMKLSSNQIVKLPAQVYTTLIRGVPDLVLMLLIFYSLQTWLTAFTEFVGWKYVEIDPFLTGVITLGFIYGAYFTETFRGAMLAVPAGQSEAAVAYGLKRHQRFFLITFPQMMRFALPGIGNNWLVLLKATALVSIIGLADLVKAAQEAGKSTYQLFYFLVLAAFIYLAITTLSNAALRYLSRKYSVGSREATL